MHPMGLTVDDAGLESKPHRQCSRQVGARIVLQPSFAVSLEQMKARDVAFCYLNCSGGVLTMKLAKVTHYQLRLRVLLVEVVGYCPENLENRAIENALMCGPGPDSTLAKQLRVFNLGP